MMHRVMQKNLASFKCGAIIMNLGRSESWMIQEIAYLGYLREREQKVQQAWAINQLSLFIRFPKSSTIMGQNSLKESWAKEPRTIFSIVFRMLTTFSLERPYALYFSQRIEQILYWVMRLSLQVEWSQVILKTKLTQLSTMSLFPYSSKLMMLAVNEEGGGLGLSMKWRLHSMEVAYFCQAVFKYSSVRNFSSSGQIRMWKVVYIPCSVWQMAARCLKLSAFIF